MASGDTYILLDDGTPQKCANDGGWAFWMREHGGELRQFDSIAENISVSTVFLGMDHSFTGARPLLFETMVFGGTLNHEQARYCTLSEAETGHLKMVQKVREAPGPDKRAYIGNGISVTHDGRGLVLRRDRVGSDEDSKNTIVLDQPQLDSLIDFAYKQGMVQ